jgi:hypothetical protein
VVFEHGYGSTRTTSFDGPLTPQALSDLTRTK